MFVNQDFLYNNMPLLCIQLRLLITLGLSFATIISCDVKTLKFRTNQEALSVNFINVECAREKESKRKS